MTSLAKLAHAPVALVDAPPEHGGSDALEQPPMLAAEARRGGEGALQQQRREQRHLADVPQLPPRLVVLDDVGE